MMYVLYTYRKVDGCEPVVYSVERFESKDELYYYVKSYDYYVRNPEGGKRIFQYNYLLKAVMTNPRDSLRHKAGRYHLKNKYLQTGKEPDIFYGYLLKDEKGRVIDLRNYTDEIYRYDLTEYTNELQEKREREWEEWSANWDAEYEKNARLIGSKPYVGTYRNIRTMHERRYACDTEQKPYIRGKRKHLPEPWGAEIVICYEKNWKARTKVKHQWMVNMPKHMDTVWFEKRVYDEELFNEYYIKLPGGEIDICF